ncbi:dynein heavy chain axonemal [Limosa lapponica baueri]|uniref:Dynein heavy chain axonemal n=1 Tax=Limosa lapponica baueri TaxID=1758121 RepID=A0A2I0TI23_LIMLA|nr:dynein heavy chain axonemal [Limosa lapponica baueri]
MVHTAETIRLRYFMDLLMEKQRPVMLVGNAGTGKSVLMRDKLEALSMDEYLVQSVPFNFYTTSDMLQAILEKPLEKKSGRNYGPPGTRRLIYFIDDMNMPEVDKYGTVAPHTLIRQHMDHGHWYDRTKLTLKDIHNCQYVACMNPTAGSFTIDSRLQRHFCVFAVSFPGQEALLTIYSTILAQHLALQKMPQAVQKLQPQLVATALALHQKVASTFLPTAIKFHYVFNLRDLSNIFQGLLFSTPECLKTPVDLVRLWLHEAERVYGDKLVDEKDQKGFGKVLADTCKKFFAELNEELVFAKPNIYCHFAQGVGDSKYMPVPSWPALNKLLVEALDNYNEVNAAMSLVLFEDAVSHICRISRILESPWGNALLVGVGGSGKQSLARLAAFISSLNVFQITLRKGYGIPDLKDLNANLAALTAEFEKATAEKIKCQQEADATNRVITLANRLIGGLASENVRWAESVEMLKEQEKTVCGDVLLVSAFVSYVGYFTKKYRVELLEKHWIPFFEGLAVPIPITPGLDPLSLLTDAADVAAWSNQGLPSDRMSTENATILCNTERWPLIVDAQLQGIKWIKNKYGEELQTIRLGQRKPDSTSGFLLQNIHLVARWLGTLEKMVEQYSLGSHEDYRVFMSAEPAPSPDTHIIPQGLLENSIKITNEPPTGMYANLHKALDLFTQVPWDDLRYLFGEIMYGGHITDDWDRRLCRTYLSEYVRPEMLEGELYLAPGFLIPPSLDYKGYHEYIDDNLPPESPYLYGLHPNAEIGFLTVTSDRLFRTVLEMQPKESDAGGGSGISREEKVKSVLDEIIEKLPEPFNMAEIMAKAAEKTPYVVVAFQECERMNILTHEIRRSLKELDLGLKGELTITSDMEDLGNALFYDSVPESWTRYAYPSLLSLGAWYADLLLRIRELEVWTTDFVLPATVWLAGFFNPQSFLTAIMQSMARKNEWPLDKMCLSVEVTKKNRDDITAPPREGSYVHGLFMEGETQSRP